MNKKTYDKVEILWKDITFFKGTHSKGELVNLKYQTITSMGYIVKRTKEDIYLAFSVEYNEPYRFIDVYKIPAANIIEIRHLSGESEEDKILNDIYKS